MTNEEKFKVEQVIGMLETKLRSKPNSCEVDYWKKLQKELITKLEKVNNGK